MNGPILRSDLNAYVEEGGLLSPVAIGARVLPPTPSAVPRGQYPKITIAGSQKYKEAVKPRGASSEAALIDDGYTSDTFDCQRYALKRRVDAQVNEYLNSFSYDAHSSAALKVQEQQVLSHEIRVAAAVFNPSNITAASAATAYTEANIGTVDFVKDFQTLATSLVNRNYDLPTLSLILPFQLVQYISRSARLQTYVLGNRPATLNLLNQEQVNTLAGLLGVKEILIGRMAKDISGTGKTESMSQIWNPKYFALAQLTGGNPMSGGIGRTFYWERAGSLFQTRTYYVPSLDSTDVEVEMNTDEKIVDAKSGGLIDTSFA